MKHSKNVFSKIQCFLVFICFIAILPACKKDTPATPVSTDSYSIHGLWTGTTQDGVNTVPFTLSVKADGTCTSEGLAPGTQENLGYGGWTLTGNVFSFHITWVYGYSTNIGLNVTGTATFDSTTGTLTAGAYHAVAPSGATNDGTVSITKVNMSTTALHVHKINSLWAGNTQDGVNVVPFYLSVKSDGTCYSEGLAPGTRENLGYGTWTLSGTSFIFHITWVYGYPTNIGLSVTGTGTYDDSTGSLTLGSYHAVAPSGATNDGSFAMTDVNW